MTYRTQTAKQRLLNTLSGHKADVIPAVPAYLLLFLADFERAYYVEEYRRHMKGQSRCAIDHEQDTCFRARAIYQSYGIFKVRPDWIEIAQGASRTWAARTHIVAEGEILYYEDQVSGIRVPMHEAPIPRGDAKLVGQSASKTDLWDISTELQNEASVDERLPILSSDELLARGDFDLPRLIVSDYGDAYFVSTILDTPFSNAYDLLGFQGLMLTQHDRPALLHHILHRQLQQTQEVMSAWAAAGVDGVYVEEVFTGADMISPRAFDEFVFAYNQPYFRHMRALGLLPIFYVCGDVVPRLDRIVELDIAAVAVEESKKNFRIEIEEVVDRVNGRTAVLGNIDAIRFGPHGTMKDMEAEVQRQARIGSRAKGFIVSTGSPFPLDTNPRNIDALVATAHSIPG